MEIILFLSSIRPFLTWQLFWRREVLSYIACVVCTWIRHRTYFIYLYTIWVFSRVGLRVWLPNGARFGVIYGSRPPPPGTSFYRQYGEKWIFRRSSRNVEKVWFFLVHATHVGNDSRANVHPRHMCHRSVAVADRTVTIRPWDDAIKSDTVDDTMDGWRDNKPVRSSWITTNSLPVSVVCQ